MSNGSCNIIFSFDVADVRRWSLDLDDVTIRREGGIVVRIGAAIRQGRLAFMITR